MLFNRNERKFTNIKHNFTHMLHIRCQIFGVVLLLEIRGSILDARHSKSNVNEWLFCAWLSVLGHLIFSVESSNFVILCSISYILHSYA